MVYNISFVNLSVSDLSSYYVNVFEDSFDTYLILPFACVICIWGKREKYEKNMQILI